MLSVMNHHSDKRNQIDSDFDRKRLLLLGEIKIITVLECSLTQLFKLGQDLINTLLSLFTLGHLRSQPLLSESSWLTICLAKTIFGRKLLDVVLVILVELNLWISL